MLVGESSGSIHTRHCRTMHQLKPLSGCNVCRWFLYWGWIQDCADNPLAPAVSAVIQSLRAVFVWISVWLCMHRLLYGCTACIGELRLLLLLFQSPPSVWAKSNFTPWNVILNTCTKYPACHTGFMKHGQKRCPTWTARITTSFLRGVSTLGPDCFAASRGAGGSAPLSSPLLVRFHISSCLYGHACLYTQCSEAGSCVH